MKDIKNLDKLGEDSKRSKDKKSAVVNEPKSAGSKSKNKKFKSPSGEKILKISKTNQNNNENFIDRKKLRKNIDQKEVINNNDEKNLTKYNNEIINNEKETSNQLKNMESRATEFDSEFDNSMVHDDIKGLNVNKIKNISAENQQLIDE